MSVYAALGVGLGGFVLVLACLVFQMRRQGRLEERVENDDANNAAMAKAHDLRDRLRRDHGFAERVRQRFSR